MINHYDLKENIKKVRFGWFDFIDDMEVSTVLLEKAKRNRLQNKLEYMEGPMGFSNLDEVGVLIKGFDHIGTMFSWYNYPYYSEHLKKLGFKKEYEYIENKFSFENVDHEKLKRQVKWLKNDTI